MEKVILGLGSNVPLAVAGGSILEPPAVLSHAVAKLKNCLHSIVYSRIWRTAPMYYENQDYFYNMAVCGMYDGEPHQLLSVIHQIEASLGRDRSLEIRNGPRTIDIDIELFGSRTVNTDSLVIPHPRMHERAFILIPMLEICPECAEPLKGTLYSQYLKNLPVSDILLYGNLPQ